MRAELGTKRLTIAAPAGPSQLAKIEIAKIGQIVDWVNLMAYDFHGTFEMTTHFGAPLRAIAGDPAPDAAKLTVTAAVDAWLAGGVPGAKLVLGMPLYGYGWTGVTASNDGLLQRASAAATSAWEPGKFDYREIAAKYLPTMTRRWSDAAKSPWLYDPARSLMISYDDAQSLAAKTQLLRSKGLGGAMFWELSSDDPQHTLVRAVREVLLR
jgi:chitinase